jgi:hypothetical protein
MVTWPPKYSTGLATLLSPPAWKSGIGRKTWQPGLLVAQNCVWLSACQTMPERVTIAALGFPVVPDVNRICSGEFAGAVPMDCPGDRRRLCDLARQILPYGVGDHQRRPQVLAHGGELRGGIAEVQRRPDETCARAGELQFEVTKVPVREVDDSLARRKAQAVHEGMGDLADARVELGPGSRFAAHVVAQGGRGRLRSRIVRNPIRRREPHQRLPGLRRAWIDLTLIVYCCNLWRSTALRESKSIALAAGFV